MQRQLVGTGPTILDLPSNPSSPTSSSPLYIPQDRLCLQWSHLQLYTPEKPKPFETLLRPARATPSIRRRRVRRCLRQQSLSTRQYNIALVCVPPHVQAVKRNCPYNNIEEHVPMTLWSYPKTKKKKWQRGLPTDLLFFVFNRRPF